MKKSRTLKDVLLEKFEGTIKSGVTFDGNIQNIDFFNTFIKAESKKQMFKMSGCNMCCLNYNGDSVLMIFAIPIRSVVEGDENRHVSERMMEIVKLIEDTFVAVESMEASEVKEDKMIYLKIIKKVEK